MGVVMKKAQYFITCSELPMLTVHELTPPAGYATLLVPRQGKKTDGRQLAFDFEGGGGG